MLTFCLLISLIPRGFSEHRGEGAWDLVKQGEYINLILPLEVLFSTYSKYTKVFHGNSSLLHSPWSMGYLELIGILLLEVWGWITGTVPTLQ